MKVIEPRKLTAEELVMFETADALAVVPSFYVRRLLSTICELRTNALEPERKVIQ
jgi:hypothetical protein